MIYKQDTPNSSNISTVKYNSKLAELAVCFLPKKLKNSFETKEELLKAQKELNEELSNDINIKDNVFDYFTKKYNLNFFDELDRLERKSKKIYIYSNVTLEQYNDIINAESTGGELNKIIIKNKEKHPYRVDEIL